MNGDLNYLCRGCDGTCCTGASGRPCTCPPPQNDDMGRAMNAVFAALREHGADIVEVDGSRYAQCPAHDDRHRSLVIRQGERGVVIKCHAGCEADQIRIALGLSWADLFNREKA